MNVCEINKLVKCLWFATNLYNL